MKKLTILLSMALALCLGCITAPSGRQIVDPAMTQSIAQDAALLTGTALDLQYHAELILTFEALDAFVAAGGGSVSDLQTALSKLPVGTLQGTNGTVLTQGASVLIHQGQALVLKLDKYEVNKYYVLPVATGLRDGLREALKL